MTAQKSAERLSTATVHFPRMVTIVSAPASNSYTFSMIDCGSRSISHDGSDGSNCSLAARPVLRRHTRLLRDRVAVQAKGSSPAVSPMRRRERWAPPGATPHFHRLKAGAPILPGGATRHPKVWQVTDGGLPQTIPPPKRHPHAERGARRRAHLGLTTEARSDRPASPLALMKRARATMRPVVGWWVQEAPAPPLQGCPHAVFDPHAARPTPHSGSVGRMCAPRAAQVPTGTCPLDRFECREGRP